MCCENGLTDAAGQAADKRNSKSDKHTEVAYTQPYMIPGPLVNNMCGGGIIKSLFQIKPACLHDEDYSEAKTTASEADSHDHLDLLTLK